MSVVVSFTTSDILRQSLQRQTEQRQVKYKSYGRDVSYGMTEISSDIIRGYNDTMILYLLRNEPSYGYEISKKIRQLSEDKYLIKETTLYSAFNRMEKNGYIESYSETADNGKKRTYYRITDSGNDYYRDKCGEWKLTKEVIEHFITD